MSSKPDTILILDFGGQYCHLIGRRIREKGVYSEIVPPGVSEKQLQELAEKFNIKGVILSGGPSSVYERNAPRLPKSIFRLGIPILGLCYGHQLLAYLMGGKVVRAKKREYGISFAKIKKAEGILKGLKKRERVWMSHGDAVLSCPPGFRVLAETKNAPVAAMANSKKTLFGIQWHPEVIHTPSGDKIFENFLFNICHCKNNWQPIDLVNQAIKEIKKRVGVSRAIVALSGGVDSSVVTVLGSQALGKRLTAVFVDHGLMREGESEQIINTFKKFDLNFILAREKINFLKALRGVKNPERKRKIIGRKFIKTFEKIARRVKADY
ncbi:MAG: GMP synthase (glutamine-hydrolyzing), partial [Candidatus Nealsonbacteria bacterium]